MIDHSGAIHHHSFEGPLSRFSAEMKLAGALILILGTVLLPPNRAEWYVGVFILLAAITLWSQLPLGFVLRRLALLSPLVLSLAVVNAWQPVHRAPWLAVAAKSMLCLLTIILVSNTTPFTQILRVLQRIRVPALLVTTLTLMHRYLFVLVEESERMRRARSSRTFSNRRRFRWQTLATVLGQLFIRASERAERIYDAMCARGWK
jgi:cobalt/nickel transport system permease protein